MFGLDKKELTVVLTAWLLFTLLTSLPYLAAYKLTPPNKTFIGDFFGYGDISTFYSFIKQASQGRWLFKNINTPEPHKPVYFNLEFLLIGKTASLTGMSIEAAFHLWRILGIGAMFITFWLLARLYFADFSTQFWLLAFFCLGSGLGWFSVLFQWLTGQTINVPLDAWSETHAFNQMFYSAHSTWANVLNSLGMFWFIRGVTSKKPNDFWLAGVLIFLPGLFRPYCLLFFGGLVGLWGLIELVRKELGIEKLLNYCRCLALPIVALSYNVLILKFHPVFKHWSTQQVPTFGILTLSFYLGLPFFFAVGELFNRDFGKPFAVEDKLLYLWAGFILFLVYSHQVFSFAYEFITLFSVPLYLLAGGMLFNRRNRSTHRRPLTAIFSSPKLKTAVLTILLIINSLTSVLLLTKINAFALESYSYLDDEWLAAYNWLENNTSLEARVIALNISSSFLVRFTGRTTYAGNHYVTVDYQNKYRQAEKFFSWTDPDFNRKLLQIWQIDYVWEGSQEKAQRRKFGSKPTGSFLEPVYQNRQITIYQVKSGS